MVVACSGRHKKIYILSILYVYYKKQKKAKLNHRRVYYKKRRFWVRDIFKNRKSQGAYYNLIEEMRLTDTEKYFNYLWMSPELFQNLVQLVRPSNQRPYNRRAPIGAGERLAATLR